MPESWIDTSKELAKNELNLNVDYITEAIEKHAFQANKYSEKGDICNALYHINKCLILSPKCSDHYIQRANIYLQTADLSSAIKDFRSAALLASTDQSASVSKSQLIHKVGYIHFIKGQILLEQKQPAQALQCFHRARNIIDNLDAESRGVSPIYCVDSFTLTKGWNMVLGRILECYLMMKKMSDAQWLVDSALDQYMEENEDSTDNSERICDLLILNARLHLFKDLTGAPEAFKYIRIALTYNPDHEPAKNLYTYFVDKSSYYRYSAIHSVNCRNLETALNEFSKAILCNPYNYKLYIERGCAKRLMKQFHESLDDIIYGMQMKKDESDPNTMNCVHQLVLTLNDLGLSYFAEEKYRDAIFIYNQIIDANRNISHFFQNRGDCFQKLHEYHNALSDYETAYYLLRKFSTNSANSFESICLETRICLCSYSLSQLYRQENSYMEANKYLTCCINISPTVVEYWAERAKLNYEFKQFTSARYDVLTVVYILFKNLYSSKCVTVNQSWSRYDVLNKERRYNLHRLEVMLGPVFNILYPKKSPYELLSDPEVQNIQKYFKNVKSCPIDILGDCCSFKEEICT